MTYEHAKKEVKELAERMEDEAIYFKCSVQIGHEFYEITKGTNTISSEIEKELIK